MGSSQGVESGSSALMSITMPAIPCPFPLRIHPDAPRLIEVCNAWLRGCCTRIRAVCEGNLLAVELFSADHLVKAGFGLLISLFFANAISTERVLPTLKLMNWFFLFDTCVDDTGMFGTDIATSRIIVDSVMAVFEPSKVSNPPSHAHKNIGSSQGTAQIGQELAHILSSTAAEWWSDMCVYMSPSQQARLSEIFRGYLGSILEEIPFRLACTPPANLHAYFQVRSHSLGWYPLTVLTECALCMEMDQEALTSPLVLALKRSVCDSIILANDVMSFRQEYEQGDVFNIIMVLCYQKLLGRSLCAAALLPQSWRTHVAAMPELLQESMNEACEMLKERVQECARMIEKIKESPMLMKKAGMGAFLEAMANNVAGNIYWHSTNQRYGVASSASTHHGKPFDQIMEDIQCMHDKPLDQSKMAVHAGSPTTLQLKVKQPS